MTMQWQVIHCVICNYANLELGLVVELLGVEDGAVHIKDDVRHGVTGLMVMAVILWHCRGLRILQSLALRPLDCSREYWTLLTAYCGHSKQCLDKLYHKALVLWLTLFVIVSSTLFSFIYRCLFARSPQYGGCLLGLGSVFTPGQTSSHWHRVRGDPDWTFSNKNSAAWGNSQAASGDIISAIWWQIREWWKNTPLSRPDWWSIIKRGHVGLQNLPQMR